MIRQCTATAQLISSWARSSVHYAMTEWLSYIHNVQYRHACKKTDHFRQAQTSKIRSEFALFDPHSIETSDSNHSPRKIRDKKLFCRKYNDGNTGEATLAKRVQVGADISRTCLATRTAISRFTISLARVVWSADGRAEERCLMNYATL